MYNSVATVFGTTRADNGIGSIEKKDQKAGPDMLTLPCSLAPAAAGVASAEGGEGRLYSRQDRMVGMTSSAPGKRSGSVLTSLKTFFNDCPARISS